MNHLLAKVTSTTMPKVAKCEVNKLKLDTYVMKYYPTRRTVFARDEDRKAKIGDVVLLQELPNKVSNKVSHRVHRIIYSLGNVTDPVTGLKCDKNGYWETTPGEWEKKYGVKGEGNGNADRTDDIEQGADMKEGTAV